MAKAASEKTGWNIKRVSLKNRNPEAKADKWENKTIKGFEKKEEFIFYKKLEAQ